MKQIAKQINICFYHCIILPTLTRKILYKEVEPGQALNKYTVNRNMFSKLYLIKIDCHTLENF